MNTNTLLILLRITATDRPDAIIDGVCLGEKRLLACYHLFLLTRIKTFRFDLTTGFSVALVFS